MTTPMILPWLARRAGVEDPRAVALWRTACSRAALITGETDGSRYWGASMRQLRILLERERWRSEPPQLWPWMLAQEALERSAALANLHWKSLDAAVRWWRAGLPTLTGDKP
ncbi:MAG: hypothetical protein KDI64_07475 [Candidatus Accumulibacter sp.]|nr:hypothetical protein [Accumulibacter sp.]